MRARVQPTPPQWWLRRHVLSLFACLCFALRFSGKLACAAQVVSAAGRVLRRGLVPVRGVRAKVRQGSAVGGSAPPAGDQTACRHNRRLQCNSLFVSCGWAGEATSAHSSCSNRRSRSCCLLDHVRRSWNNIELLTCHDTCAMVRFACATVMHACSRHVAMHVTRCISHATCMAWLRSLRMYEMAFRIDRSYCIDRARARIRTACMRDACNDACMRSTESKPGQS